MKTFKVYLKQDGEGCDYTIGCGKNVITVIANNIDDVKKDMFELIKENYNNIETKFEYCEIYEVSNSFICPLTEWYKNIDDGISTIEQENILIKEKAEYERLKNKFDNDKNI